MPERTSMVPHFVMSAALDEIYYLRAGCAYEAGVLKATLNYQVPMAVRLLFTELITELLAPSARGIAYTMPFADEVDVNIDAWERERGFQSLETGAERGVAASLYGAAVMEVFLLRQAMATAAARLPEALTFKSLPKGRQRVTGHQVDRLSAAASGEFTLYRDKSSQVLIAALSDLGAKEHLTTPGFAVEVETRRIT